MVAGFEKPCPKCGALFHVDDLLSGKDIHPIGMVLEPDRLDEGLYYFNHQTPDCGGTFAVPVATFDFMLGEPVPAEQLTGTKGCGGHCTRLEDLTPCSRPCSLAPYRRFLVQSLLRR